MLPDRSILIGQKLEKNVKIKKFQMINFGRFSNTVRQSHLVWWLQLWISGRCSPQKSRDQTAFHGYISTKSSQSLCWRTMLEQSNDIWGSGLALQRLQYFRGVQSIGRSGKITKKRNFQARESNTPLGMEKTSLSLVSSRRERNKLKKGD